jgi:hypothetical protein
MTTASRSLRSAYRTTAVVDWLTLEIEIARSTQFQWLQRTLANHFGDDTRAYILAVDPGAGGASTKFLIRLNDACCRDIGTIRTALATLDQRHALVGPAIIKGLEVSLDFYPTDEQARADLLQLVARLQMSLAVYGTSHRQVGPSKRPDFLDSTRKPDPQQTLYINNKSDPVSWRVYHKITDQKRALPRQDHRARVEFTLQGAGLHEHGINSLDDLAERGFVGFGHFRQFHPVAKLIAGKKPALAYLLQHATRRNRNMIALYPFGRHAYRRDSRTGKPRNGGRPELRNHSTHTIADAELNHLVRDRLRDLTQLFHTKLEAKS